MSRLLPMKDLTKDFDYHRLVEEERRHYRTIEVTAELKEGGVHAHSAWEHYWRRVGARVAASGRGDLREALARAGGEHRPLRILSLGSGYCGHEIGLSEQLDLDHRIVCTDIDPELFERARAVVAERGLPVEFMALDLNFVSIEEGAWDLIMAHASLHHLVNLEHVFSQIHRGLTPGSGIFHIVEVAGENRRLIWQENEDFANRLLSALPPALTGGVRLAVSASDAEGMEGVRQEDLLPLLRRFFAAEVEILHGAFMRFVCTDSQLGRSLDPADPVRRRYLDLLIDVDESAVRHGILRPLEVWGIYRPIGAAAEALAAGGRRDAGGGVA